MNTVFCSKDTLPYGVYDFFIANNIYQNVMIKNRTIGDKCVILSHPISYTNPRYPFTPSFPHKQLVVDG